MLIKKKVIVKLFKSKDPTKCVYQKKKVIVKLFKRKVSNEISLKKKVIVNLFKRPDSNEIWSLKKRLLCNFLNVKIPKKYVY